jgi:ABC-type multidrug transport system permease subunit
LVIIAGVLLGTGLPRHPFFWIFLLINCLTFASLGVIVGFLAKSHEDTIIFSNLFILPMAFFCGTFFPLDRLPLIIKYPLYLLPLTHVNVGLRTSFLGEGACLLSLGIMLFVFVALFTAGSIIIKRHDT